jgi:hypothetical protein
MANNSPVISFVVFLVVILIIIYVIMNPSNTSTTSTPRNERFTSSCRLNRSCSPERPTMHRRADRAMLPRGLDQSVDDMVDDRQTVRPNSNGNANSANYESLIYDNTTGTIMTGTQFMENTGIIAPPWVAPAWNPDAYGPSSKGELDPADYENDPRMLYNKCSLSCCSPQYPTPFQGDVDPFVCDKNGKNKYLASDYTCQNNTGGVGCLCMTPKQVKGMHTGFVNYYVDKENLGY